jgi:acyl-CoA hydrolase/RimJ/RimL family protein N-acetyltransferase
MNDRPRNYDPGWQDRYRARIVTPDAAVAQIRPGQRIFIGSGCGAPLTLVRALTRRAYELPDSEIVHLLTFGEAPYAHRELAQFFRTNSFFIGENVRGVIQEGLGDYTPIHLSDIPRLLSSGQLPLDAALIQVSPPDAHGLCSLGVSVDIVRTAARNASLVIAQVNPRMPRTRGDSFVHVHELDWLVPVEEEIIEAPEPPLEEETQRIAENIAPLIEDGATLEIGIGVIPQVLPRFLKDKKNLGIHTEMISDSIVELVESGVVTGNRKTRDKGKIVTSFCSGTRRLYDLVDDNPLFAFHPTEYVNNPAIIAQHHKMVAVNVALEIDLTGQVCADSVGEKFFSGVGGQVDFNRGATKARGGKAIIAIPSTALNGTVSRIVTHLSPGAGVVTTRAGVSHVVTEHGVAYLHGKRIQERAMALICIAHPKFRAQLLREAIEAKYLSAEFADHEGKLVIGPSEIRTTYLLHDGTQILFRPIHPTDEPAMRDLFYELSEQSRYYRFMGHVKRMPRQQIEGFLYIDHRSEVTIVGVLKEAHGEEIIAVGSYYLMPGTNRAEIAFTVADRWQRRGIGTFMLRHLARIARANGIRGFTAEVLADNKGMRTIFDRSEFKLNCRFSGPVYSYEMEFD